MIRTNKADKKVIFNNNDTIKNIVEEFNYNIPLLFIYYDEINQILENKINAEEQLNNIKKKILNEFSKK